MMIRVLLAVKEPKLRRRVERLLKQEGIVVQSVKGAGLLWDHFIGASCDMVITSYSLIPDPKERSIHQVSMLPNAPRLIILTDREDLEKQTAFRAAGADAILYTEVIDEIFREAFTTLIDERRLHLMETVAARRAVARPQLSDFVSSSSAMNSFMKTVHQVVGSETSLLILGETGVGKERLARAIHEASSRYKGPFISVNCGAIPENLIESEFFGHEEGAFTGATRARRGAFELAHRGTLFLDEIGEMPLPLQVKLLHVLQDFEIAPIGAEYKIPVDVRVMAATNRDLVQEVEEQRFRRDLYYRLGVISLHVPALRERGEDIPALAQSFVREISTRIGRPVTGISEQALNHLLAYSWPGNVRELINVIERAVLLCEGNTITAAGLPEEMSGAALTVPPMNTLVNSGDYADIPYDWLDKPLKTYRQAIVAEVEKNYLRGLLEQTRGRIAETARRAGIHTRALHGKMKKYRLRKEDYKP